MQASYTYTTTGARASLTYANGTAETYTYNLANWVTGVTNTSGDSVVSAYAYSYYASGNQRSKTDHEGTVTTYTYDGLGRLTQESEMGGLTVDYAYGSRGNRSQMTVTGTDRYTVQYTYDANNRLTQEEKTRGVQTGLTTYSYDPNGNLTQRMELGCDGSPSAASFTYDVFGQQATATYNGATTAYTYNAQGIRVAKTTAESRTDFLLDGGNVAAEQTDGDITAYLRGVNLIARSDGGTTEYYLYNAHGDVVQRTDSSGAVTKAYTYDAFGVEQNPDSTDPNPFRYCGEYFDRETGTYYLRARYYSPETGRFTQEDTHWNPANRLYGDEPQKINERTDKLGLKTYAYAPDITAVMQSGKLYAYCAGNPIYYFDRSGSSILLSLLIGFAVGAVLSGGFTIYNNVKNDRDWYDGLAISMLAGGVGGAISCITIPGVSNFVSAAVFGAAGNLTAEVILGDIQSIEDVADALFLGAVTGLIGNEAAELLTNVVTEYFASLTKAAQKDFLQSVGQITNRELTAIRQTISKGLTPDILIELIEKYGYSTLVSAFVSSTSASAVQ